MDHEDRVDAVERELTALIAAVEAGPLDAPVPTCPAFTIDDLAAHVGSFSGFWTHVLCEGSGRPKTPFTEAPGDEGRVSWLTVLAGHLVVELRATPADTTTWTWYEPDQSAGFIARRCANELAIHRVDAEVARGSASPVEADLAVDGIEEVFVLIENGSRVGDDRGAGETLHLHGTDHDWAEWMITLGPEGVAVERSHGKGDLALKGPVSDLEMLLYQRPTTGEVEHFGDDAVLAAFHRQFTFD